MSPEIIDSDIGKSIYDINGTEWQINDINPFEMFPVRISCKLDNRQDQILYDGRNIINDGPAYFWIWEKPQKLVEKHKCTCSAKDLFNYGCKCGGI